MALEMVEACLHDVSEQDVAAQVDGLCPLCLAAEIERLRDGIQSYIDGNFGREVYFKTKHDTCPHGKFSWEDCEACIDDHFSKLIGLPLAAPRREANPELRLG